jgi:single-strand DNA-binding protein
MNTVILSGNLTRDVELRFLPNGTAIGAFGVASNRKWTDAKTGEKKEEVTFVDVTAFGKQAETIGQYFKKGAKILLTGRLKLDQWDDKQTGAKRSKLGVVLESFEFMSGKTQGGENEAPQRTPPTAGVPATPMPGSKTDPDDDIPFRSGIRNYNFSRLA